MINLRRHLGKFTEEKRIGHIFIIFLLSMVLTGYASAGRQNISDLKQDLIFHQAIGNQAGVGAVLSALGRAYNSLSQYTKAIEYHEQALAIAREVGNRSSEGIALNNVGLAMANLSQYTKAIEYYEQALVIAREVGNRSVEGTILNNLST